MNRTIDITKARERRRLNTWVRRSMLLFSRTSYLDNILTVYPFVAGAPTTINAMVRRDIISAHQTRNSARLIELLEEQVKFPYEDPVWYLIKEIKNCRQKNPLQLTRIVDILYTMTSDLVIAGLEAPPKLNTQTGPMFANWVRREFRVELKGVADFKASTSGLAILDSTEEEGKVFVEIDLGQPISKRPDLIAKVNRTYLIGEAKWIGQPGGNQEKQVQEVLKFCREQRGDIRRLGIIDGFPWATRIATGRIVRDKVAVLTQEATCNILSALLLRNFFQTIQ